MTKITKNGIIVTLEDNTITKRYSKNYISCISFSNNKLAKQEFGKFRKDHKAIQLNSNG